VKALSLWQPWASWVALEWKKIETRKHNHFKSLVGQRILIHAAKKWDERAFPMAWNYLSPKQIHETQTFKGLHGLLCTAFVKEHRYLHIKDSALALCACDNSLYGLILVDIQRLKEPIPWRGGQGIFEVSDCLISLKKGPETQKGGER